MCPCQTQPPTIHQSEPKKSANMTLSSQEIKDYALSLGFHLVGIAAVETKMMSTANARLQAWLDAGYQADMGWMANPRRQDIYTILPEAKSVIAVALNYYTPHQRPPGSEYGKIARYAWGRDYHKVLERKLKQLTNLLTANVKDIKLRYYVDTGPIQDKFWAQSAGLGWIAKNGNVITRSYGSWVFLGEIVTDLELEPDSPHTEHCGTCNRCLEACPTNAIVQPYVVDANRCIAYHTIENRDSTLPPPIAQHLEGWVAGCDVCQDVCPWNQRFARSTDVEDFQPYPGNISPTLTELATMTEEQWSERFPASALRRIKPSMWRRNAQANLPDEDS
jgi:epoxyqueuosine reductase